MPKLTPLEDDAYSAAHDGVHRTVLEILRAHFGPTAVVQQQIGDYTGLTKSVPASNLAAVAAASLTADHARTQAGQWVRAARAEGTSWTQLATALRFNDDQDGDLAELAFETVAGKPEPLEKKSITWDCGTCGAAVIDYGPYERNPQDDEKGHTEDCARHQAAIADYDAATGQ
ncbi:hypothetical protein D5S17_35520 [Pseudonocardiaceae bacterium YIM PH 21723]|nr:hypothetical protein D5S17_35520 [Pseudonocardiaceae bacterium YIM PH 21723]